MKHNLVYKDSSRELMVIPECMKEEIIKIAHRKVHFSTRKTQEVLEREVYILNIVSKVDKVVRSCKEFIITEAKTGKPETSYHYR